MRLLLVGICMLLTVVLFSGCDTPDQSGMRAARLAQRQAILNEAPGDYYIGRRYYNSNYKFWGYLRRPGQPWRDAKLVVFNENQKLAPDREINQFGVDDNCEYKIYGHYSNNAAPVVYEPASNGFYPEFILTGYELRDRNPPSIFAPGTRLKDGNINQPD